MDSICAKKRLGQDVRFPKSILNVLTVIKDTGHARLLLVLQGGLGDTVMKNITRKGNLQQTLHLTVAGRSQHLSRFVQPRLHTISNIWSWNCTTKRKRCHK